MHPCPTVRDRTFGIELEFEDDIDPLIRMLHADGALPEPRRHGYHCTCSSCRWDNRYTIKAQHDSSCGGEIITKPFNVQTEWDQFVELTNYLQASVIEAGVDAGLRAGSHVHVRTPVNHYDAYAAFVLWHEHLVALAQGRWSSMRQGNNTLITGTPAFNSWVRYVGGSVAQADAELRTNEHQRRSLYIDVARPMDRHSTLNVNTSTGCTWEYRLWNSTKLAWRMRAYVAWSLALSDTWITAEMLTVAPRQRDLKTLGNIFLNNHHPLAAASLNRQLRSNEKTRS